MKKTGYLSLLLSAAVLLGCLCAGGALTTSAAVSEWTAAAAGQYINFARYADLSTIVSGESLVKGMTPYGSRYNSAGSGLHVNEGTATGSAIGNLTDGQLAAQGTPAYTAIKNGGTAKRYRYFYFDLGAVYDLTDFIIASNQNGTGNFKFDEMRIFTATEANIVGQDYAYSSSSPLEGFDTKVFELTSWTAGQSDASWTTAYNFHIRPATGTQVRARYVCFELYCGDKKTYQTFDLDELAVYGTPYVAWNSGDTTGRFVHFSRYGAPNIDGTSLLLGKDPYGSVYSSSQDGSYVWQTPNAGYAISNMNDGIIGTKSGNDWAAIKGNATNARCVFFDLGATYRLTDFVVASAQHKGAEFALRDVQIYVAAEDEDMTTSSAVDVSEYELVFDVAGYAGDAASGSWTNSAGVGNFHVQPAGGATVTGRYVCFVLNQKAFENTNHMYIGELGVYGTPVENMGAAFLAKKGTQLRSVAADGTTALRFGFDLKADGVDYAGADRAEDEYARNDLSQGGATVTVDGEVFILKDFGAIVSTDPASTLQEDNGTTTKKVPALKLYEDKGDDTVFTAVVTNIDTDHYESPIYARGYAVIVIDGVDCTVYGEVWSGKAGDYSITAP